MANKLEQQNPQFFELNGTALNDGYVYIGVNGLNPETNPIPIFLDGGLSIPISQPLRTTGGYIYYNGNPISIYFDESDYSITVKNSLNSLIYTNLSNVAFSNTKSIDTIEDLATYTGTGLVIVKDINRGGSFVSKTVIEIDPNTNSLYSVNDITVFAKLGGGFWARQYNGCINLKWTKAVANVAIAQDIEIQKAIDYCSNTKKALFIPDGAFYFYNLIPKSNVHIFGSGSSSKLIQIQPSTEVFAGIKFTAQSGEIVENFNISLLEIDGNRLSSPAISYNNSIFFQLYNGQANNISFNFVNFVNNQNNAIMFASYSIYGTAKGIKVTNCKINGKDIGSGANKGGDLIRLEAVNYTDGNYGQIRFTDIEVTNNYAEEIRTLGDIKRGCSNFIVSNNITKNMYDCHHSVDGSFNGQVTNNSEEVTSSFSGSGSTFTNFIEVQGENILISGNNGNGAGLVRDGIYVTAYGHPNEPEKTPSNNFGHQSVNVKVHNNNFTNITGTGHRLLQVVNGVCTENSTSNATNYSVAIESGVGGYTDASNVPFIAKANIIDNNKSKNCGLGTAIIKGIDHFIGSNTDEYGQEDITYYAGQYSKRHNELNLNPTLRLKATGVANNIDNFLTGFYPEAISTLANVVNLNYATEINDESATVQRQAQIGRFSAKQNDIFHIRYFAKNGTNTANGFAIIINEHDSSNNFLLATFLGQNNVSTYTEHIRKYKVTNANCAYIVPSLCPSANYSAVSATGSILFGNVRISKNVIGD